MTEPEQPRVTARTWDVVSFEDGDMIRRGRVVGVSSYDGTLTVMAANNQGFQVSPDKATVEARPA